MKRGSCICITICSLLIHTNFVHAESGLAGTFSPELGRLMPKAEYETSMISEESVHEQDVSLSFIQQELGVLLPLRQSDKFESALTTRLEVMDLATRARLIEAGATLPDHLWNIDLGGYVRGRLDNEWIAGLQVSIGSPSDKPFDSLAETSFSSTGTLQIPANNNSHHLFFLNYATNREFLPYIPIPGYAYQWSGDRTKQVLLGIPLSWGQWMATKSLRYRHLISYPGRYMPKSAIS